MFTMTIGKPCGHIYYVVPQDTSNSSCPPDGNACFNINTYVQNLSQYFVSNSTFIFLPGNHFLNTKGIIVIQDIYSLDLIGNGSLMHSSSIANDGVIYNFDHYNDDNSFTYAESLSKITCTGSSGFLFSNITSLRLINITITNCGVHSSQTSLNATTHLLNVNDLLIHGVTIKNSTGYGLLGVNVLGHSAIRSSSFIGNNQIVKDKLTKVFVSTICNNTLNIKTSVYNNYKYSCSALSGGNLYLKFQDLVNNISEGHELILSYLVLSFGIDGSIPNCQTITPGTGLAVVMEQKSYDAHIIISHILSYRNQGQFGSNFYFKALSSSDIKINKVSSKSGVSTYGSVYFYAMMSSSNLKSNTSLFIMNNSALECNYGVACGSLYINTSESVFHNVHIYLERSIIKDDTTLTNDTSSIVESNAGHVFVYIIFLYANTLHPNGNNERFIISGTQYTHVRMDNSYLMYAELLSDSVDVYISNSNFDHSRITAINSSIILNGNVNFTNIATNRNGGSILLLSSKLFISECAVVFFAYNYASYGGALYIDLSSFMYLFFPSNVSFIGNTAYIQGGAIYIQSGIPSPYTQQKCALQFNANASLGVIMFFEDNYAGEAGSVLYGGNIDSCTLDCTNIPHQYHDLCTKSSGAIFNMTTYISQHDNSTSLIASDPTIVCYCKQSSPLQCSHSGNEGNNVYRYPGETVSKLLITQGQRGGVVPGVVYMNKNNGYLIRGGYRNLEGGGLIIIFTRGQSPRNQRLFIISSSKFFTNMCNKYK